MMWKNIGYLMFEDEVLDEFYKPSIKYKEKKVFCNIKSIGQSEFYQAQVAGLKPEIKVEIKLQNLDEKLTHFKLKGKLYKILRTYKKEDIIELVLTSILVENE